MYAATTVLLLAAAVLVVRAVLRWRRRGASIPGPPGHPILGNFPQILQVLQKSPNKLSSWFEGLVRQYGYLIRFWFGPLLFVCVMEARDVDAVLSSASCSAKPWLIYRLIEPFLGRGLLTLNGPTHRRHRKLILPSLHRDVLAQLQPLMQMSSLELADSLADKAASGEVFDACTHCGVAALNATYRTILNVDEDLYEATREHRRKVVENTTRISELLWYRVFRPWCHPDVLFRLDRHHDELNAEMLRYERLILDVLESKLASKKEPGPQQARQGRPGRQSFLDHVLASREGRSLSAEEVFMELKTMVAGSFATSMDVLSMVLLVISILPDEQARLHEELDDLLGDRPMEVTDVDHLVAMERFIKETLRYSPPFPALARACERDLRLPSGHTLPAGCTIVLSPLATHWNPKYFPEPQRFDSDRFLPAAVAARPAGAYIPFSGGGRSCIGERYAFMLLKTCLASVLRRFDVLPDPDGPKDIRSIRMTVAITYHPKNGCRIRLRERRRLPAGG